MKSSQTPTYVGIPKAAELAGVSVRQIVRRIEKDQIPVVQIGRRIFIMGKDFDAWKREFDKRRQAA